MEMSSSLPTSDVIHALFGLGRVCSVGVIHTWSGGVIGRSREGRRRGGRFLRAAVQQLQELKGAGKLPERDTLTDAG